MFLGNGNSTSPRENVEITLSPTRKFLKMLLPPRTPRLFLGALCDLRFGCGRLKKNPKTHRPRRKRPRSAPRRAGESNPAERPVQHGFAQIFTNTTSAHRQLLTAPDNNIREKCALAHITKPDYARTAPYSLHPPVKHLHSIEKSTDTIPRFSLTLDMKRVKR